MYIRSLELSQRCWLAILLQLGLGLSVASASALRVPQTTPVGITLVEEVREDGDNSQPQLIWVRLGDADGRTVFISDQDQAGRDGCVGECAQGFLPVLAQRGARAFADWSLVRRKDGAQQWAYQSHPLYTWVGEKEPGQVANNVAVSTLTLRRAGLGRGSSGPALLPPAGWQVARFQPGATLSMPDGIEARLVASAQAVALVDVRGLTLYSFDGDVRRDGQTCTAAACSMLWIPVPAPAIAQGTGDFSVITRPDGSTQWAYHARPLYVYRDDKLPGDVHGAGVDRRWSVAQVSSDFRPSHVAVSSLNGYGDVVSVNGMTLYGGYPFEKRWGGRNLRDTFLHNAYHKGKRLGGGACVDADCLKNWHPLLAPADAVASGFWEPITRPDGSRQWAYKGYALYTYGADKIPGDHSGQATYAFEKVEGNSTELKQAFFILDISKATGAAAIYWNIAKP